MNHCGIGPKPPVTTLVYKPLVHYFNILGHTNFYKSNNYESQIIITVLISNSIATNDAPYGILSQLAKGIFLTCCQNTDYARYLSEWRPYWVSWRETIYMPSVHWHEIWALEFWKMSDHLPHPQPAHVHGCISYVMRSFEGQFLRSF